MLALAPLLAACATANDAKLPCPVPTAQLYETPHGVLYVFDEENMEKMVARLDGLKAGTCLGLPAPEPLPDGARPT